MRLILASLVIFLVISSSALADTVLKKIDIANIGVDLPDEILVEKGWTQYLSIKINNTGQTNIYQISTYFTGSPSSWFEMDSYRINALPMGKDTEILAKILVPSETKNGEYRFSFRVDSNEISYEKNFLLKVFATRDEMLIYQVDMLEKELDSLVNKTKTAEERGINLTFANELIYQIRSNMALARDGIKNEMYTQVTESIREVEKLIIKADYEVSNPPTLVKESQGGLEIPFNDMAPYLPAVIGIVACASIIFLVRKNKIINAVRLPNLKVREAIVESPRFLELDAEIGKLNESIKILGDEYSQGVISKESYDDLRMKYQEKVFELENEKRKEKK